MDIKEVLSHKSLEETEQVYLSVLTEEGGENSDSIQWRYFNRFLHLSDIDSCTWKECTNQGTID